MWPYGRAVAAVEILLGDVAAVVVVVLVAYTPSLAETGVDLDVEGFDYNMV